MKISNTTLNGLFVLEPKIFEDDRGFFYESFNQEVFSSNISDKFSFVQDNHSKGRKGVIRGLHYQEKKAQGKLLRVTFGEVFDVTVDLRLDSSTFGKWFGVVLSAENKKQLWVPPGFAHGFLTLSDESDFLYKTTDYYAPEYEFCIKWNDPTLDISWPLERCGLCVPILSAKDELGKNFLEIFK